jgi:aldose sugar dehydrogenase
MRRHLLILLAVVLLLPLASLRAQQPDIGIAAVPLGDGPFIFDTAEEHGIRVDVVSRGLVHPFSIAFLPNGDALVVERGADIRLVKHATGDAVLVPEPVTGGPPPAGFRGGGLHDLVIHPDFATNSLVYFTYNRPGPTDERDESARPPVALTIARARFDGTALHDAEDIFSGEMQEGASGSRLAFGPNDMLFVTTGAPFGDEARKLDTIYGKVLRLNSDGTVPRSNPFASQAGAAGAIYSFGHRDQLGLTVHPQSGSVLAAEHGPNGGDEINLILPGRDYGWPDYSFGRTYEGPRLSATPLGPDTEQPLILWIPSIAPTGLTFYTGDALPAWQGNLFVGSSRRGEIPRTGGLERIVLNDALEELRRESLLTSLHQRIRDVRQGPDGLLYVITDEDDGALLRISPQAQ